MAKLEPETVQLIEILSTAGFDWLVTELIQIVNQGRPSVVGENELFQARKRVDDYDDSAINASDGFDDGRELEGREQIEAVISLVQGRFAFAAEMIIASQQHLETISGGKFASRLVFSSEGEKRSVTADDMSALNETVDGLKAALRSWGDNIDDK